jgi:hypothetical protein
LAGLDSRHPDDQCARTVAHNYADMNARSRSVRAVKFEIAGSKGIEAGSSILPDGRCRIPFPDLRTETTPNVRWLPRRQPRGNVSTCPRYRARARKLTAQQEAAIRALAGSRSLRSLAADFGVSCETIRAVVRLERLAV